MRKVYSMEQRNSIIDNWGQANNLLLNANFKGNKEPIYYIWKTGEFAGLTGKTTFDSIVAGTVPSLNGLTEESKQEYVRQRFAKYGLDMIGKYTNRDTPVAVVITKGRYKGYRGEVRLNAITQKDYRGKVNEMSIDILTEDEKRRYFREYAESRGYKIIDYPEKLAVRGKCTLLSPQGNEWETVWYHFAYQGNCNCPLDVKRSIGERMVRSLLKENGINFEEQKKIVTDGRTLFFDFYLPDDNTYIEYNGKQHYEDTGGYYKGKLQDLQERDQLKDKWCNQVGANLVVIPYTVNSINEVANVLSEIVPIKKRLVSVVYSDSIPNEDIIDYYKTHTGKETCRKYDLTQRRLSLLCNRVGFSKRKYLTSAKVK
ncbi:hypothetical protein DIEEDFHO_00123 [Enterococcus phage vB_OCPT_Bill]|uniref:VSR endonuclease n=1 Tax=Enterococcus phage vB_OCPT_Bill TaxID=2922322 RepID=A0AAE9K6E7_9CAUD|nr:hypothetical protein DIEEDFHO_00123 [Enterococcus phage vB_OCPT_Bill]